MTEPHLHTATDLYQLWASLLGPLGFSHTSLWLAFIDAEHVMTPVLTQIEDIPPSATTEDCLPVLKICRQLLDDSATHRSVALLLSRPGRHPMSEDDRSWARGLTEAAGRLEVRMEPLHLATDHELRVFAPDDLLAVRSVQRR